MRTMMQYNRMAAAASAVDMFSCANTALSVDASILVSIIFSALNLRLRSLLLNLLALRKHFYPKDNCPIFT